MAENTATKARERELLAIMHGDPGIADLAAKKIVLAARHGDAFLTETSAAAQAGDRAEVARICEKWAQA